jgi:dihydroorotase
MKLRLSQVLICDPTSGYNGKVCDLLISEGVIQAIETSASGKITTPKGFKEILLKGKTISPSLADLRADFCDPGLEYNETIESGSLAALNGGFTDVAILPSTKPARDNKSAVAYVLSKANTMPINVYPYGTATQGREGKEMAEIFDMKSAGAIAFTDGNRPIENAGLLLRILQYNQIFDGLLMVMANDQNLSAGAQMHEGKVSTLLGLKGNPAISEETAINRDIEVLRYAGGKIHFSCISSKGSVDLIRKAKRQGLQVTCDVAMANLCYTDEALSTYDANFKVVPPLRGKQDQKALWEGIADGTIDAICSNHHPQRKENKAVEFEYALPGMCTIEYTFQMLVESKPESVALVQLINALSTQPRKILGLPALKIEVGGKASFVIYQTKGTTKLKASASKSINHPFLGKEVQTMIHHVIHHNQLYTPANHAN